jgi:hypothetical protein
MFVLRRKLSALTLFAVCIVFAGASASMYAQKGGPNKPDTLSWPCQLTLRDGVDESGNPTDAILSDGQGSYVNGQDGTRVKCKIAYAPGTAHDGWLEMFIDADSVRYMTFPGRAAQQAYTKTGYSTFVNRGSFEVKVIRTADVIGATYLRPFRAYVTNPQFAGKARFVGDSFLIGPNASGEYLEGTSSVFVTVVDACTWQVTSDPAQPITAGESSAYPRVLKLFETKKNGSPVPAADFLMPFPATVRIIGVKPGCGAS